MDAGQNVVGSENVVFHLYSSVQLQFLGPNTFEEMLQCCLTWIYLFS